MTTCSHHHLTLIPAPSSRMRCRRCHLSIKADELNGGYCPECYEKSGHRHKEFEEVAAEDITRYRCEACGIVVQCHQANR